MEIELPNKQQQQQQANVAELLISFVQLSISKSLIASIPLHCSHSSADLTTTYHRYPSAKIMVNASSTRRIEQHAKRVVYGSAYSWECQKVDRAMAAGPIGSR